MSGAFFDEPERYLAGNGNLDTRRAILREMLAGVRDARVLDIGCGDGSLSRFLLEAGNRVTYVDASAAMLERARSALPAPLADRARFERADFFAYAPPPERHDVVLALGLLAHLPRLDRAFVHLAALVAPGGRVIVQHTDAAKLLYLPNLVRRALEARAVKDAYGHSLPLLTTGKIRRAAAAAGLTLVAESRYVRPWGFVRRRLSPEAIVALQERTRTSRILSRLGWEVVTSFRAA